MSRNGLEQDCAMEVMVQDICSTSTNDLEQDLQCDSNGPGHLQDVNKWSGTRLCHNINGPGHLQHIPKVVWNKIVRRT